MHRQPVLSANRPCAPRGLLRRSAAALPVLLSLGALGGCCDDDGGGSGGGGAPPAGTVAIDFELRTDYQLGNPLLGDSLLIDLNGDGIPDVVEAAFTERQLRIGLGIGNAQVVAWQELETPGEPLRVVAADLAGTGAIDFVVLCVGAGGFSLPALAGAIGPAGSGAGQQLAVFRADGDGIYSLRSTLALDVPALDMAAGPLVVGSEREHVVVPQLLLREVWVFEELVTDNLLPVSIQPAAGFDGEMGPFSVALIDAGADGALDIAVGLVGNFGSSIGGVSLLAQDGALGFEPELVLPVVPHLPIVRRLDDTVGARTGGVSAQGTPAAGFDDLAIADAHPSAENVMVLAGEDGLVGEPYVFANGGPSASAVAADVNGDGARDLVFTLFDAGGVSLRLSDGGGGFGQPRLYNAAALPRGLSVLDLDGDGRDDIGSVGGGGTSVLLGLQDGRLRAAQGFFVGLDPQFIAAADLDGDGLLDAVSIDVAQRELAFLKGLPERQFEYAGAVPLAETAQETPASFAIADFDGDGFLDVLVSASQSGDVRLLRGGAILPPAAPVAGDIVPVGNGPRGLDVGDIDGDGVLDALVAVSGGGVLRVLRGVGGGTLEAQLPIDVPDAPLAVKLADLDGDGALDAVVVTDLPAVLILRGDNQLGFELAGQFPLGALALAIQVGDLVEDGRPDVLVGQAGITVSELVLLENLGDLDFASRGVAIGVDPGTVELVDADGDGHLDILSPLGSGRLVLLGGDGLGNFAPLPTLFDRPFGVPFGTRASTLADLDGDGRAELLMVSPAMRQVWVARNTSTGLALP